MAAPPPLRSKSAENHRNRRGERPRLRARSSLRPGAVPAAAEQRVSVGALRRTRITAQIGRFGRVCSKLRGAVRRGARTIVGRSGGKICLLVSAASHEELKLTCDVHGELCVQMCESSSPIPCTGSFRPGRLRPFIDTLTNQTARFPTKEVQPERLHGRHDSIGECVENQIDLFACRRCPSARCSVRQRRERCRIGLFDGKRIANRDRRAAQSGGNDRRPSLVPVRLQGAGHQSQQRALCGGHHQ